MSDQHLAKDESFPTLVGNRWVYLSDFRWVNLIKAIHVPNIVFTLGVTTYTLFLYFIFTSNKGIWPKKISERAVMAVPCPQESITWFQKIFLFWVFMSWKAKLERPHFFEVQFGNQITVWHKCIVTVKLWRVDGATVRKWFFF